MADFCKQCSEKNFGVDFGDLANISTAQDTFADRWPVGLCEGCGPICVDHTGKCITDECLEKHGMERPI